PHCPRGDREALARGGVALLAGTHRIPGLVSLGTSTPELDHPQLLARRQHRRGGDPAAVREPGLSPHRGRAVDEMIHSGADPPPGPFARAWSTSATAVPVASGYAPRSGSSSAAATRGSAPAGGSCSLAVSSDCTVIRAGPSTGSTS